MGRDGYIHSMEHQDCSTHHCGGRKCYFEARYDEIGQPTWDVHLSADLSPEQIRAALYHRVYIHDICTACGKVVKRKDGKV